jgi:hypothetical protein
LHLALVRAQVRAFHMVSALNELLHHHVVAFVHCKVVCLC